MLWPSEAAHGKLMPQDRITWRAAVKICLFDIDGTILRTGGVGSSSFNQAFFELFGVQDAFSQVNAQGRLDPDLIHQIASSGLDRRLLEHEFEDLKRRYLELFSLHIADTENFEVFPGVREIVTRLSETDSCFLGNQTGNFKESALLKLERAALANHFTFGGYGCSAPTRGEICRAAIEKAQALFQPLSTGAFEVIVLGDSPSDILAAKEVGARSIAVGTGGGLRDELLQTEPDLFVETLQDTDAIFHWIYSSREPLKRYIESGLTL